MALAWGWKINFVFWGLFILDDNLNLVQRKRLFDNRSGREIDSWKII